MLITQSVVLASDAFLFCCILIQALWDIFSLGLAAFYFHIVGFFSFNRNRAFLVCFMDTCCVRNLNCFCSIMILLFIDRALHFLFYFYPQKLECLSGAIWKIYDPFPYPCLLFSLCKKYIGFTLFFYCTANHGVLRGSDRRHLVLFHIHV